METGRPGPRGALGLLKGTVLGAGGEPHDRDEVAEARGVSEPLSCPQSPLKLYPSHPSSKPTLNPPEPLFLQPRPQGASPFPYTGESRQEKEEVSSSQGQEGYHQDRAIFVGQALG